MPAVIWVTSKDGKCSVHLFGRNGAGEFVRHRHASERQQQAGSLAGLVGPAVGRSNGDYHRLRAGILSGSQVRSKLFTGELPATTIEQNQMGRSASGAPIYPLQQSSLRITEYRFAGQIPRDATEKIRSQFRRRGNLCSRTGAADGRKIKRHAISLSITRPGLRILDRIRFRLA
jgi:hypothetical protein